MTGPARRPDGERARAPDRTRRRRGDDSGKVGAVPTRSRDPAHAVRSPRARTPSNSARSGRRGRRAGIGRSDSRGAGSAAGSTATGSSARRRGPGVAPRRRFRRRAGRAQHGHELYGSFVGAQPTGAVARDDHHRRTTLQRSSVGSERFPDRPLDPVAHHRVADLLRHRDSQSRRAVARAHEDDEEVTRRNSASGVLNVQELPALPDTRLLREGARNGAGDAPVVRNQPGCLVGIETVRRLRPLRRRRLMTCRPVGLAIRARKPCVLFRRRLLG